jgi:LysM repeat protein
MIQALLVVGLSFFNPQVPSDSLGIQTIDGKIFVLHKVGEKETVYGLSKRYGTTVDEVIKYNPSADAGLEIGLILKIPYVARVAVKNGSNGSTHKVAEKETLYSISRIYNVTVDEIKQWNNLSSNDLALGQVLVVKKSGGTASTTIASTAIIQPATQKGVHKVEAKETLFSISRQYNVSVDDIKKWNNLEGNELKLDQLLFVAPPTNGVQSTTSASSSIEKQVQTNPTRVKETPVVTPKITISEDPGNGDEISQSGLAELIEGTDGNRKYLALHRTAPTGTILKVRNEMNNREVFVRVMGKLPDTALTDKLIIKVSKSAYDRLGAIDPRFRVEVTYYK